MTREILAQYCDLQEEVKDLRKRKEKTEREIIKIEEEGEVIDSVKGGMGGIQNYKIRGFPYPEYSRKKSKLYLYRARLENAELELLETVEKVENYIQSIDNSRIRRIIRHRFIDKLTWNQVAMRMGGNATEDSVKKEFQRFVARN